MTEHANRTVPTPAGGVRGPQSLVGGLALMGLAAFSFWAMSDLPSGTLRSMGPGLLPRALAVAVGACGLALAVTGMLRSGEAVERGTWRGPMLVCLAIVVFALTIRPFPLGGVSTPGLGLAVAGPLCIVIGGYATPEARFRDLLVLGFALTAFSMLLFGDLLNLPIPNFPQWLAELFPAGWSQKAVLRVVAGVEVVLAGLIFLSGRGAARGDRAIDVARHSAQA